MIDMDKRFYSLLTELAYQHGCSQAEVIRNAVASYAFLIRETSNSNRKLSITNSQDSVVKDICLPK